MAKQLYIFYTANVDPTTANKLRATIAAALEQGFDDIIFLVSSGGGNVYEGLATAAFIKALEVQTTMHNIGQIDSVANVIFAAGKTRYATKNSSFMYHGVATHFQKDENLIESQVKERYEGLMRHRQDIVKNYSAYTGLPLADVEKMMVDGGNILSSTEALEKRIISGIKEPIIPIGSKVVTIGNA